MIFGKNKGMNLDNLAKQFTLRKLTPKTGATRIGLIADLITYDRKQNNMKGVASVREIQPGGGARTRSVIQIVYQKK